jgi:heat shock protein HslJ
MDHTPPPRRSHASVIVLVALVAGLIAACAATAAPSPVRVAVPDRLAGTEWKAVEVAGAAPQAGREPSIVFEEVVVSGSGGCNAFSAGYRYDEGSITFEDAAGTLMGCDGPVGRLEGRFLSALAGAATVSIDPEGRLILDGPGGRLVFEVGPRDLPAG